MVKKEEDKKNRNIFDRIMNYVEYRSKRKRKFDL
jgi:hypothetical protein